MRFCLLTLGSRGDTQPYAALGLALMAQGHAVTLCAPENFEGLAKGLGLDFAPVPWDTHQALQDSGLRSRLLAGDVLGFFRRAQAQAWDKREAVWQAWLEAAKDADVLVPGTTTEDAAVLLGQALGKQVVFSELSPFSPSSGYAAIGLSLRSLGPLNRASHWLSRQAWWSLNRPLALALAKRLDLPAPKGSPSLRALRGGAKVLHGFSAALQPPPGDWAPAQHAVTGSWRLDSGAAQSLPGDHQDAGFAAWLEDGVPPLYLGFGSMPAMAGEDLLELAGDLAEQLETRVVLGAGWTDVDSADCDLPEGVAIVNECDHGWLFARCSAVVHHGGAGTTHAALAAGLPQVVCPFFADQPFWADRVRRSGAGVVLPFKRLDAESLALAVGQALAGPCQDAATALAERSAAEGGAGDAAEHLGRWSKAG